MDTDCPGAQFRGLRSQDQRWGRNSVLGRLQEGSRVVAGTRGSLAQDSHFRVNQKVWGFLPPSSFTFSPLSLGLQVWPEAGRSQLYPKHPGHAGISESRLTGPVVGPGADLCTRGLAAPGPTGSGAHGLWASSSYRGRDSRYGPSRWVHGQWLGPLLLAEVQGLQAHGPHFQRQNTVPGEW